MPVKEIREKARTSASIGARLPIPAKLLMRSLPVRLEIAIMAKKAARFVTA